MGELEEKIKKELLKSGFPLQVFCQRCLLEKDWRILESSEYYILENDTRKQIDVVGYFREELIKQTLISYELHIECKKSEDNPWVFFKDERRATGISPQIDVNYRSDETARWRTDRLRLIEGLHFNHSITSSIYTPAFRKNSNPIYKAVASVLSSYHLRSDFLRRHREQGQRKEEKYNRIKISFLTILFDGKLFLADVGAQDDIKLEEVNNVIYCQRETEFLKGKYYTIDVVTRDYFLKYLDVLNKDRKLISDFYKQEVSAKGV